MGGKFFYIALIGLFAFAGNALAQSDFDDIYYNPKKDKSATYASTNAPKQQTQQKQSNYIADLGNMDVDAYNRRGQYYVSSIDTIGAAVESAEDFVYTQQIQKFYNPTIVVDNANALGDILSNAYGNVEIVINNNGLPVFAPYYGYYGWNWPYYSTVWSPWSWGFNIGPWGWSVGWYDPWYSWNWGWGPGWWNPGPGWGPGWGPGPGPGWGPGWRPHPGPMASWSPAGNRPVGPRPGWSSATQHRGGNIAAQPGVAPGRPGGGNIGGNHGSQPGGYRGGNYGTPSADVVNNNGRWQYNTTNITGHREAGTGVLPGKNNSTVNSNRTGTVSNNKTTITTNGHRTTGTSNNNRTTINSNRTPNRTVGNASSRSTGVSRSTGGGSRSGGGGGGRHR
ncbi:MAG: hypothetical protein J1F43_06750 [Muribaculaceae bacterium]|nr:hypothetical protein [Muribaculaceae bacterium]